MRRKIEIAFATVLALALALVVSVKMTGSILKATEDDAVCLETVAPVTSVSEIVIGEDGSQVKEETINVAESETEGSHVEGAMPGTEIAEQAFDGVVTDSYFKENIDYRGQGPKFCMLHFVLLFVAVFVLAFFIDTERKNQSKICEIQEEVKKAEEKFGTKK